MKTNRALLAILLIGTLGFLSLLSSVSTYAETTRATENLRGETVILPVSVPERERLVLVSFLTLTTEAEMIGAMVIYDDPQTEAETDYLELYDKAGGLLSVSWLDPFGIRRPAMDFGLLVGEHSELQGFLVLLTEGTPL